MTLRAVPAWSALVASLLTAAACDDATTATSPTASPVTETFAGQVAVGGAASRSFSGREAGLKPRPTYGSS